MSSGCTAMRALGVGDEMPPEKKEKICKICQTEAKASESLDLWETKWLLPGDKINITNKWKNKKLAKYAAYELILAKKIENIKKDKIFLNLWKDRYKRLREIQPQAQKILKNKYQAVICYNSLYGVNRLFFDLCQKKKVPFLSLSHSNNSAEDNEFILIKNNTFSFLEDLRKNFKKFYQISAKDLRDVKNHSSAQMQSKKMWNYSAPITNKNIKKTIGKYDKKVLVCLSSPDENFAADFISVLPKQKKGPFFDQIEMLKWVKKISRKNQKILYWIRPHPRLYPNKREKQLSEMAKKLEKERLQKAPKNYFWPILKDQGSLWHHLKDTTILFNAWSSIGDEFGKHGIPVVTFFPQFNNSGSLIDYTSKTKNGYEKIHDDLIKKEKIVDKEKNYLKWISQYLNTNTFHLKTHPPKIFKKILDLINPKTKQKNLYWLVAKTGTTKKNLKKIESILRDQLAKRI